MVFDEECVIATYAANAAAEEVVEDLRKSGYDITNLSIIQKGVDIEHRIVGVYCEADCVRSWGARGALWGCALGVLSGFILFHASADMGLELIMNLLAAALVGSVAVGVLSVVAAIIHGKVSTRKSAFAYDRSVKAGDTFLLLAHGPGEAAVACAAIAAIEPMDLGLGFDAAADDDMGGQTSAKKGAANTDADTNTNSRGGKLRLVFQRRLALLRRQ